MIHADPTLRALLAACVHEPDDDSLRLILADAMDECASGDKTCDRCDEFGYHRYYPDLNGEPNYSDSVACIVCRGTKRIPDSLAAWATYLRAAVELERLEGTKCNNPTDCYYANKCDHGCGMNKMSGLRTLTSSILAAHGREWVLGKKCERCGGSGYAGPALADVPKYHEQIGADGRITRFVNPEPFDYRPPPKCTACEGRKVTGPLSRVPFESIGWSRGLPCSVKAPLSEWGRESYEVGGLYVTTPSWLPSSWALAVCEQWPVVRCGVADKEPPENDGYDEGPNGGKMTFDWFFGPSQYGDYNVGTALIGEMRMMNPELYFDSGYLEFTSREAAHDALARAIYSLTRLGSRKAGAAIERKQGAEV